MKANRNKTNTKISNLKGSNPESQSPTSNTLIQHPKLQKQKIKEQSWLVGTLVGTQWWGEFAGWFYKTNKIENPNSQNEIEELTTGHRQVELSMTEECNDNDQTPMRKARCWRAKHDTNEGTQGWVRRSEQENKVVSILDSEWKRWFVEIREWKKEGRLARVRQCQTRGQSVSVVAVWEREVRD